MSKHSSDLVVLDAATDEFARLLDVVVDADWARSTPCDEWDVGALVDHVIGAARIYTALLHRRSFADALKAGDATEAAGSNRRQSFRSDVSQLRDAFGAPDVWTTVCDVPGGSVTGAGLATVRIFDVTVHCWDLARSIGEPEIFPESIVSHAWTYARRHYGEAEADRASRQAERGNDAPSLLAALLALTGRSPDWRRRSSGG